MAFSVNQAVLVGNLTKDPDLKFTPGGTPIMTFNMVTNRSQKNKDTQQWTDIPTFHRIVVWGKMAEYLSKALHKGIKVAVTGRIDNRSWKKQDGTNGYISEVVAQDVIPMTAAKGEKAAPPQNNGEGQPPDPSDPASANSEEVDINNIPF